MRDLFPAEFVCVVKNTEGANPFPIIAECRRVDDLHDEIIVAFDADEVPQSDHFLNVPGAIFDWRILDEKTETITFRRDTRTDDERERDRQAIANEAREMMDVFGITKLANLDASIAAERAAPAQAIGAPEGSLEKLQKTADEAARDEGLIS